MRDKTMVLTMTLCTRLDEFICFEAIVNASLQTNAVAGKVIFCQGCEWETLKRRRNAPAGFCAKNKQSTYEF